MRENPAPITITITSPEVNQSPSKEWIFASEKHRELSSGCYSCPHLLLSFFVIVSTIHTEYGEHH